MSDERPPTTVSLRPLDYRPPPAQIIPAEAIRRGDRSLIWVIGGIIWLILMVPNATFFQSDLTRLLYLCFLLVPFFVSFIFGTRCLMVAGLRWRTVPAVIGTLIGSAAVGLIGFVFVKMIF